MVCARPGQSAPVVPYAFRAQQAVFRACHQYREDQTLPVVVAVANPTPPAVMVVADCHRLYALPVQRTALQSQVFASVAEPVSSPTIVRHRARHVQWAAPALMASVSSVPTASSPTAASLHAFRA